MGVQINGDTGNVIATKGTFSGDVGIGGTLTYEDVTNVDSIGIITAREGIEVGARPGVGASISVDGNAIFSGITTAVTLKTTTGIVTTLTATTGIVTTLTTNTLTANSTTKVGSGVTLSPDGDVFATGVCTATSFVGSGSNLTGTGLYSAYALMEEAIEHGATAHTKTAGDWYTKQLTRITYDPQSIIVSLSNNQFTLAAGTYVIKWIHLLERCDEGVTRLYDVTNSTSKKVSLVGFAQDAGNYAMVYSHGVARVTITGNTTYKYQYFVTTANSILYGPTDSDYTEEEIFGQVEVWKEA